MDKRIAAVMARDQINSRLKAKRKIEEIDEKRSTSVSYTHLDVYKRQI